MYFNVTVMISIHAGKHPFLNTVAGNDVKMLHAETCQDTCNYPPSHLHAVVSVVADPGYLKSLDFYDILGWPQRPNDFKDYGKPRSGVGVDSAPKFANVLYTTLTHSYHLICCCTFARIWGIERFNEVI